MTKIKYLFKILIFQIVKVTPLGRAIAGYPVLPRFGKMLALSHQYDLFQYTICIVAALSVQEVFFKRIIETFNWNYNLIFICKGYDRQKEKMECCRRRIASW